VFKGVVVSLDRTHLDRIRNEVHRRSRGGVNAARRQVAEMLLDALWARFTDIGGPEAAREAEGAEAGLWNAILAADGLASIDDESGARPGNGTPREQFDVRVREQRAFSDFLVAFWPIRRPVDVLRSLGDPSRLRRAAGRDLHRDDVARLAASWAYGAPLSYQDVALLDEIDALLGSPPRPSRRRAPAADDPFVVDGVNILTGEDVADDDWEPEMQELTTSMERLERSRRVDDGVVEERPEYAHIVVDEAQDLSPMQWRMLGRRGRQASWTVVEDPAQSAWEDLAAARRAMDAALGGERPSSRRRRGRRPDSPRRVRHEYELTTNYRNSTEIAAVSARVLARALPEARPARAVRSSGIAPIVRVLPESGLAAAAREAAERLLPQVEGTIGVIVPFHPADAQDEGTIPLPHEIASAQWDAAARERLAAGLPDRVQVLDVLEAKGLEFDAAVIAAPETVAAQSPNGLRVLYVAVSRATQHLVVLTADPAWKDTLLTG
jgi:hypothetical protein